MRMTHKLLTSLCLLLLSLGAKAHQPKLSSTHLVEQGENKWLLQVQASLTAFEYEIEQHYGESSYASPKEFQKLLLEHVRQHLSIRINGEEMALSKEGIVRVGHDTKLAFLLTVLPEDFHSLQVKNTSFENIERNQSVLIVLKKGFLKRPFILNDTNGHTAELKVEANSFVLDNKDEEKSQNYFSIFLIGLSVLLVILFVSRQRLSLNMRTSLISV